MVLKQSRSIFIFIFFLWPINIISFPLVDDQMNGSSTSPRQLEPFYLRSRAATPRGKRNTLTHNFNELRNAQKKGMQYLLSYVMEPNVACFAPHTFRPF